MSEKYTIDLRILHALPASGKTTFAENLKKDFDEDCRIKRKDLNCFILNMDKISLESKDVEKSFKETLRKKVNITIPDVLILDGLFLTKDQMAKAIKLVMDEYEDDTDYKYGQKFVFKVTIESWNEDRESCLRNDILRRRDKRAATTIKNAVYDERFDKNDILNLLEDKYKERISSVKIKRHVVYSASDMEVYFAENDIFSNSKDKNKIYSSSWCGGGCYGNCWDDTLSPVSADDPPKYFEELVDVIDSLKTVKPISIKDYFRIMDECVKLDSEYESDYYGGGTTYYRYVLNLSDLYNFLEKNEFLES